MNNPGPYIDDPFQYRRLKTREVKVGDVGIGGDNPIRLQSMTIADTMDTEATVAEAIQLYEAGSEVVRITAPSKKDAENLGDIKREIAKRGYDIPIAADIHFAPAAAMVAVEHAEKVRINPGNYTDKKKFKTREYTDAEYAEELERVHDDFKPLVLRAKELGRAMRIGTNHGSLSDRIMNRFGDTPEGMVESAVEFIKIAEMYAYHDIIVSMKASNPVVMVHAYRLLTERFRRESMNYPLHLGVTEAGEGTDGRIKSVIGIGSLLEDGIGDTIRVSLTEDSIHEIPVAREIANRYNSVREAMDEIAGAAPSESFPPALTRAFFDYAPSYSFKRRNEVGLAIPDEIAREKSPPGRTAPTRIVTPARSFPDGDVESIVDEINAVRNMGCDAILLRGAETQEEKLLEVAGQLKEKGLTIPLIADLGAAEDGATPVLGPDLLAGLHGISLTITPSRFKSVDALFSARTREALLAGKTRLFLHFRVDDVNAFGDVLRALAGDFKFVLSAEPARYERGRIAEGPDATALVRGAVALLQESGANTDDFPILLRQSFASDDDALYGAALHHGGLLLDGLGDALCIDQGDAESATRLALDILQAVRLRMVRTEFISCPSCGRTLFDLQETTARIKARTGHLKGVKIAIMGCIVNGPGEMADADFGYVGAGPGKIHLYREKTIVKANIPSELADEELVALIKEHGMWQEAPTA